MFALTLVAAVSFSVAAGPTPSGSQPGRSPPPAAQPAPSKKVDLPMPPPPAPNPATGVLKRSPRPGGPKLLRMVALDPTILGDISERLRTAFGQALLAEIRKLEAVSVLSSSEIREIISVERQRQLLGCGEDADTCMAELAGALDVSESLAGELSLVGTKYTLSLRRINLLGAQVTSKTRTFEKRDGEELLAVVGPMIQELFPERPLLPGKKRGVSAEVVRRLNPPPLPKWAFFTTAGASAVAGVAGGALGLLSGQAAQQHNALAQTALTSPVSGEQLAALRQQATGNAQFANAAFIGAGVLAVGAAVQFFFTDWQPESAAPAVVLVPASHGAALVGTF